MTTLIIPSITPHRPHISPLIMKELLPHPIYFVTGIDTDAGKTIATGYLSSTLRSEGVDVITQKLIQTGNTGLSEDICKHRDLEGRPLTQDDLSGLTCPLIYSYPCSPHMAIAIDGRSDEISRATESTRTLSAKYDMVLLEGAGGLMVPLTEDYLTIDYIRDHRLPVILVTTAKLGSINHTLLSLEVLRHSSIPVAMVIYNTHISTDDAITRESERYLRIWLTRHMPETSFILLPSIQA